ncbi:MAG TPA: helix-turn-helix transcriptional regulator [Rhodanobacteraceae bacterium]|nr:helix-turn-helix transcriptional regulator [Rhodanobacteraceae bacterium]
MQKFIPAKKRIDVSPGESVRIIRELQGLSQTQLASLCGIPQTTISSIETGRVTSVSSAQRFLQHRSIAILRCWSSRVGSWILPLSFKFEMHGDQRSSPSAAGFKSPGVS